MYFLVWFLSLYNFSSCLEIFIGEDEGDRDFMKKEKFIWLEEKVWRGLSDVVI